MKSFDLPILIILLLGLGLALFTVSPAAPPAVLPWPVSKAEPLTPGADKITFTVDPASVDAAEIKATITNRGKTTLAFGADYRLQIEQDGVWYEIKIGDLPVIKILYTVAPEDSLDLTFALRSAYGPLPAGAYRLVKTVSLGEPAAGTTAPTAEIAAPFEIK